MPTTDNAARALFDSAPHQTTTEGEFVPGVGRKVVTRAKLTMQEVRQLSAEAWDEGYGEGVFDAQGGGPQKNPYREASE